MIYKVVWAEVRVNESDYSFSRIDHFVPVDNYDDAYRIYASMVLMGDFPNVRLVGPVSANGASAVLLP